jgi:hypothetical protein
LKRYNIPSKKIYIFVASEEEKLEYEKYTPVDDYNEIIVGVLGITKQRNFITQYFPDGLYIISIDDDIEQIRYMGDYGNELDDFEELIQTNYVLMNSHNCDTWGVYPKNNTFFMKPQKEITYCFKFIIGCLYGFINNKDYVMNNETNVKGDYERSVLSFMNCNAIMRCNHIGVKTKLYANGGLGKNRDIANLKSVEYLVNTYPLYFARKFRKNGREEIRVKKI